MDDGITIGVVEVRQDPLFKFDEAHLAIVGSRGKVQVPVFRSIVTGQT
jgi:hypothetical protein